MCFSNSILLVQVAKVYVSVFGDERGKEVAMAGLKSKAKYVRGQLGRRMKLRLTPEIRFIEDESFERGSRVRITILPLVFMVIYYMCLYNCNLQSLSYFFI
jgi:ribosome-binding factor A